MAGRRADAAYRDRNSAKNRPPFGDHHFGDQNIHSDTQTARVKPSASPRHGRNFVCRCMRQCWPSGGCRSAGSGDRDRTLEIAAAIVRRHRTATPSYAFKRAEGERNAREIMLCLCVCFCVTQKAKERPYSFESILLLRNKKKLQAL